MKAITKFLLLLLPFTMYSQWTQVGQDIYGQVNDDYEGYSTSINNAGNIILTGAISSNSAAGQLRVFENINNTWQQIGQTIIGPSNAHQLGTSTSINGQGNIIAGSAPLYGESGSPSLGVVQVYENINNQWIQVGDNIVGENTNDLSGTSISLNNAGNIIAVGAEYNNVHRGHVRIFENINNEWVQLGSDIEGIQQGIRSGTAVSLNNAGTIVAIGARDYHGADGYFTGQTRVFEYVSGEWVQIGNDIEGIEGDHAGRSLSLNEAGNILAIGARTNDTNGTNTGCVRVYENVSGQWVLLGNPIYGDVENGYLGQSVSLNGNGHILAVSAPQSNQQIKILQYESGNWNLVNNTIFSEGSSTFGDSVSINQIGDTVSVGDYYYSGENTTRTGVVRIYNNALLNLESSNFSELIKLFPNPSHEETTITLGKTNYEKINFEVFNTSGSMVYSKVFYNTDNILFKTSAFASGVYVIKISTQKHHANLKLTIK